MYVCMYVFELRRGVEGGGKGTLKTSRLGPPMIAGVSWALV